MAQRVALSSLQHSVGFVGVQALVGCAVVTVVRYVAQSFVGRGVKAHRVVAGQHEQLWREVGLLVEACRAPPQRGPPVPHVGQ